MRPWIPARGGRCGTRGVLARGAAAPLAPEPAPGAERDPVSPGTAGDRPAASAGLRTHARLGGPAREGAGAAAAARGAAGPAGAPVLAAALSRWLSRPGAGPGPGPVPAGAAPAAGAAAPRRPPR